MQEQHLSGMPDAGFVARFLAGLPPDLAASFDRRQLFAIQQAFGAWDGIERRRGTRIALRTPWGRYAFGVAPLDPRDRRLERERRASLKGAAAGLAAGVLVAGGLWLLMA